MEKQIGRRGSEYFHVRKIFNRSLDLWAPAKIYNRPGVYRKNHDAENHQPCHSVKKQKECLLSLVVGVCLLPCRINLSGNNADEENQNGVRAVRIKKVRPSLRVHTRIPFVRA